MEHEGRSTWRRLVAVTVLLALMLVGSAAAMADAPVSAGSPARQRPAAPLVRILLCHLFRIGCPPRTTTTTTEPSSSSSSTTRPTTTTTTTTTTTVAADYWGVEGTIYLAICGGTIPGRCREPVAHEGEVRIDGAATVRTDAGGHYLQYLSPGAHTVQAILSVFGSQPCPVVAVSVSNPLRPEHVDLTCKVQVP